MLERSLQIRSSCESGVFLFADGVEVEIGDEAFQLVVAVAGGRGARSQAGRGGQEMMETSTILAAGPILALIFTVHDAYCLRAGSGVIFLIKFYRSARRERQVTDE